MEPIVIIAIVASVFACILFLIFYVSLDDPESDFDAEQYRRELEDPDYYNPKLKSSDDDDDDLDPAVVVLLGGLFMSMF